MLRQGLCRDEIFQGKLAVRGHIWLLLHPRGVVIAPTQAKPLCLAKDWGSPANPCRAGLGLLPPARMRMVLVRFTLV